MSITTWTAVTFISLCLISFAVYYTFLNRVVAPTTNIAKTNRSQNAIAGVAAIYTASVVAGVGILNATFPILVVLTIFFAQFINPILTGFSGGILFKKLR